MRSDGAVGAGRVVAVGAHIAGAGGLLLQLQQRLRQMVAQPDLHQTARAYVQGVASAALPAGRLVAVRRV